MGAPEAKAQVLLPEDGEQVPKAVGMISWAPEHRSLLAMGEQVGAQVAVSRKSPDCCA